MIPPMPDWNPTETGSPAPALSLWAKVKAWFRNSLTIFVARIGTILSVALLAVSQMADVLNLPEVKAQLGAFLEPKTVSLIGLGAFVVVELARRRSLPKA